MSDLCPRFAESWINHRPPRLWGRQLRPYSLWHACLLALFSNPILRGEAVGYADVERAIRILACRYPEVPSMRLRWWHQLRWPKPEHFDHTLDALAVTIADHNAPPEFWESTGGSSLGQPPGPLSAAIRLMLLGKTENEAWDTPVGKAWWMASAYSACKGAPLDFITPLAADVQARLDAALKLQAEGKLEEANRAAMTDEEREASTFDVMTHPHGGEEDGICPKCGFPHPEELACEMS